MQYTIFHFLKETLQGKTLGRILFNREVSRNAHLVKGKVLDIGAGLSPSYKKYLPENCAYTFTDIQSPKALVAGYKILDANKKFDLEDNSFDTVLLFNSLYIYEDPAFTLSEIFRVLKPGGHLLLSSPFLYPEISEPHDYQHFTAEGIIRLVNTDPRGSLVKIIRMGDRGSSAVNLLHPFFFFSFIRLPFYLLGLFIDKLSLRFFRNYRAPMGHFVVVVKK